MQERPYVRNMIREALKALNGKASYSDIRDYIHGEWSGVNDNTITAQIIVCTVNHPSRTHYPENQREREYDERYDFLYTIGRGQVMTSNPDEHGRWGVRKNKSDGFEIYQIIEEDSGSGEPSAVEDNTYAFALENHLRDFLVKNLSSISITEEPLYLYSDANGRDGREYPTDVGPIDILAVNAEGNFVVLELKVGQGPDRALGQILRYMGWVKTQLAGDPVIKMSRA